ALPWRRNVTRLPAVETALGLPGAVT
ncbi:hypothetical protein STIAU_1238, partial [Stigmatella aurantiaca DW4/3-1]